MLKHLRALLLPVTVIGIIPALLLALTGTLNPAWGLAFPANALVIAAGVGLLVAGLSLIVGTVRLFIRVGQGTLAPWDPTQRLVAVGVYRYVRNPMISGVIAMLFGEALLSGSVPILAWALVFTAVNLIYIPLVEEPGLRQRFGVSYQEYARHVPRWLPRRTPWQFDS